jgi:TetR/AcrR family transcriptional regulator
VTPATTQNHNTRERILEVAYAVFAEHGYAGTSVRRICARAEVNAAAMHYHWGSKERLWQAVIERTSARLMASMGGAIDPGLPPGRMVEAVIGALFDALAADPRPARLLLWTTLQADSLDYEATATAFDPLVEVGMSTVAGLEAAGVIADVDHEVVIPLLHAQIIYAFVDRRGHRRFYGRDLSDAEHAARFKREFLRSVRLLLGLPGEPS